MKNVDRSEQSMFCNNPARNVRILAFGRALLRTKADGKVSPEWVTALATLALAIFAVCAWQESRKTTTALREQLEAMRASEQAHALIHPAKTPRIAENGSICWDIVVENIGRGVAYDIKAYGFIKVGGEKFEPTDTDQDDDTVAGMDLMPQQQIEFTVTSRQGISKEFFEQSKSTDGGVSVLVEFDFATAPKGSRKDEKYCVSLNADGSSSWVAPARCTSS